MDIGLAVEKLLGVAEYGTDTTYADLQRTWRDARPIPKLALLEAAWETYLSAQAKKEERNAALTALKEIDDASIRSIREWIVKQPSPPTYLTAYDAQATAQREKLK